MARLEASEDKQASARMMATTHTHAGTFEVFLYLLDISFSFLLDCYEKRPPEGGRSTPGKLEAGALAVLGDNGLESDLVQAGVVAGLNGDLHRDLGLCGQGEGAGFLAFVGVVGVNGSTVEYNLKGNALCVYRAVSGKVVSTSGKGQLGEGVDLLLAGLAFGGGGVGGDGDLTVVYGDNLAGSVADVLEDDILGGDQVLVVAGDVLDVLGSDDVKHKRATGYDADSGKDRDDGQGHGVFTCKRVHLNFLSFLDFLDFWG